MQIQYHAAFSVILSGVLYSWFKSAELAVASLLSGILIDLDHIFDYMIEFGIPNNIREFFQSFYGGRFDRLRLVLHSWEIFFLMIVISWIIDWNMWNVGIVIGFGLHLALDQFFNRPSPYGYFLLWRYKKQFDTATCFPLHNSR
jgi:hypothetical protein